MSLKMTVKVGGITNLSDARYCAGMNVDMLGFVTVPSKENFISGKLYQDIRGWISGPSMVAEIHGIHSPEEFDSIIDTYRPDYLELSFAELPFNKTDIPIILRVDDSSQLSSAMASASTIAYLLTSESLVDTIQRSNPNVKVLVEAQRQEVIDNILKRKNTGLALTGSQEISPGLKDYDHLAEVLESLEVD
jgi:phosphoribosylanthranilate isomerase